MEAIHIGDVIRKAVVFDPSRSKADAMNADNLIQSVARLFDLLRERQIDYVLVGGVAMLQYVEGRNTEDIDLIMALASLHQLPEIIVESQEAYFARAAFDDLRIDVLLTQNPLFDKVRRQYAADRQFVEQTIPCATVEGLLLLKLYALPSLYRQGDFTRVGLYENDVATLLHSYRPALDPLLHELADYMSDSDLAEVRAILAEIQARIDRFDKGHNS